MDCCRCAEVSSSRGRDYAALLGFYLGDGCVSTYGTHTTLRVSCDAAWPGIVGDVTRLVGSVNPRNGVFQVKASGVTIVQGNWQHWPCLFPQHGPGRKHDRPIVLVEWQEEIVTAFPADFLRGLFHSDGCRTNNWATRMLGGEKRRYDYPRWQFSNRSGTSVRCAAGPSTWPASSGGSRDRGRSRSPGGTPWPRSMS